MPASAYHADPVEYPSLSSSCAQTLVSRSALHAMTEHPRFGGVNAAPTSEMDFGSICHELILGSGGGIAIWDGDSWRGKEAAAFWDEAIAKGQTPIKAADHARAQDATRAWFRQLEDFGLGYVFNPAQGESEKVVAWKDGGVWCRAMIDRLFLERGYIWDLKCMGVSAHPKACASRIVSMGYDLRSEFYKRGVTTLIPELNGRLKFGFIFAETTPPYAVTPVLELDGMWKTLGVSKMSRAIEAWGKCLAANRWPAYVEKPFVAECPPWELNKEMGAEVNAPK